MGKVTTEVTTTRYVVATRFNDGMLEFVGARKGRFHTREPPARHASIQNARMYRSQHHAEEGVKIPRQHYPDAWVMSVKMTLEYES